MLSLIAVVVSIFGGPLPAPELIATPVPFLEKRIAVNFAAPPFERASGHRGIDLSEMTETAIRSPLDGEVSFVGKVFHRSVVTIRSNSGLRASFEPICSDLVSGEKVARGDVIGNYCLEDPKYKEHCSGCVHFSIRTKRGYLNPKLFLGLVRPSVLVA